VDISYTFKSNYKKSSSSGIFSTSSTSYVDITNLSVSFGTPGGAVEVRCIPAFGGTSTHIQVENNGTSNSGSCKIRLLRDATVVGVFTYAIRADGIGDNLSIMIPPSSISFVDFPSAGTYTYTLQVLVEASANLFYCRDTELFIEQR